MVARPILLKVARSCTTNEQGGWGTECDVNGVSSFVHVRWKLNASETCWIRKGKGNAFRSKELPPSIFFLVDEANGGDVADLPGNDFREESNSRRTRNDQDADKETNGRALVVPRCSRATCDSFLITCKWTCGAKPMCSIWLSYSIKSFIVKYANM